MSYDVSLLWYWLVLAALVGMAIGWRTEGPEPQAPWFHGWVRNAVILFVLAFVLAMAHAVSGRAAFWVETAVLFSFVYAIGCVVGGGVQRLRAALQKL